MSFLSLFLVVIGLFSFPGFQTKLVQSFTNDLKKRTGQEVLIDKVSFNWNGRLKFTNFLVLDHHNDTLLFVKNISTSVEDFRKLSNNDYNFDRIETSTVLLNIKKYPQEVSNSLNVFLNKLKKPNNKKRVAFFKSSGITVSKSRFQYVDLNKARGKTINIRGIELYAENFKYQLDSFNVDFKMLKGVIESSNSKLFEFKGKVNYSPGILSLPFFDIVNDKTQVKGSLSLLGENNSFKDFNDNVKIALSIDNSILDANALFPNKIKNLNKKLYKISLTASGSLNNLLFKKVLLQNEILFFSGDLNFKHFFEEQETDWFAIIDDLKLSPKAFEDIETLSNSKKQILKNLGLLKMRGEISSQGDSLNVALVSSNTWGDFSLEGILGKGLINSKVFNRKVDLALKINKLLLDSVTGQNTKITLVSSLLFTGDFQRNDSIIASWKGTNTKLSSSKEVWDNIEFEGLYSNKQLRNTFTIKSEPIVLKSDVRFDYKNDIPEYTILANVSKVDLNKFGIRLGEGKRVFKGVVLANLKGKNIDDLEGKIRISSASIINEIEQVDLNPISIEKQFQDNKTIISISNTDCISGNATGEFNLSELSKLFQNALHQVYPFLEPKVTSKGQHLRFDLKIHQKVLDALYPDFAISENIILKGKIASDRLRSQFILDAPLMQWNDIQFQNIHFQIDTNNPIYNTFLSIEEFSHEYYTGSDFNMISTKLSDTLYFRSEFLKDRKTKIPFEINFYNTQSDDGVSFFGLKKSELLIGNNVWIINPLDDPLQKLSYSANTKEIKLSNFSAVSGNQTIRFSGSHRNKNDFLFSLITEKVLLENLLPFSPFLKLEGATSITSNIERSPLENKLSFSGAIKALKINNQFLGDFNLNTSGNTLLNAYTVNSEVINNTKKSFTLSGVWDGLESPNLNFELDFSDLDLAFLSPFGRDAIKNFSGQVTGKVRLWGALENLKHSGSLNFKKGGFHIPFLNLNYTIQETNIDLNNQFFMFNNALMNDSSEETSAILNGTFSHSNFKNWQTNLSIYSERMLLLNTIQTPEALFFGKGFLGGQVRLDGPTKNLKISLAGSTQPGTSIKIPWAENYGLSDTSFISFIDKSKKRVISDKSTELVIKEIRGVEMNFDLDVTNQAEVEIVIDKETGSYLNGRGAGNLFMEINTNGKFNIWGDFITFDGIYNFKNLGVIDKKFNLKPGGSVVWEGNPLEAQMNLEAIYDVPGGANPAILLDNPSFNKKIPTEVLIRLEGNLLKPDNPVFEINFPNTSGIVASEINYRLADPQRSQLQALSLLSQGIFINEVSVSMEGITNNLYQKASDIFSDLIGEENDKLKVGIDYLQGDKSVLLDIATEDRLGFTLSTKISDKILLNGKIGVPVGGLEQTLVVGNVQIDFILNDEGTLRAKVFNKENEFRYIGDELGYTQGLGISYNVDFETFKELIYKISSEKKPKIDSVISKTNTKKSNLIEFVKKN